MTAPSVAVHKDAIDASAATTRDLAQITVATGDAIAVVTHTDAYAAAYVSGVAKQAGTATISAITPQQEAGSSGYCGCSLHTLTVTAGGTLQLRVTFSSGPNRTTSWTYVATGSTGIGVTGKTTSSTTTITTSLTCSQDSYVLALAADWNATAGATTTLTPASPSPVLDAHEVDGVDDATTTGSFFSSRGGHWSPVGAGPAAYGTSVPTSAKYVQVACELLGTGGTPATVTMSGFLAAPAGFPAGQVMNLSGPNYATTATDLGGGAGSWADTGNADGAPDSTYATWTVV